MIIIGIIIGLLVGGGMGAFAMALVAGAHREDEDDS